MRYSHVLHFPNQPPFDRQEFRWPSFIGEFVKPVVEARRNLLYWFTNYGSYARFRVHPDHYDEVCSDILSHRQRLGLVDKDEEKDLTLINDLGSSRFIGTTSCSTPEERSEVILRSLKHVCDLVVHSVFKNPNGYWQFELNTDVQNPVSGHLFSVLHLYHNLADVNGVAYSFLNDRNEIDVLSYYYFRNLVGLGQIKAVNPKVHVFPM